MLAAVSVAVTQPSLASHAATARACELRSINIHSIDQHEAVDGQQTGQLKV